VETHEKYIQNRESVSKRIGLFKFKKGENLSLAYILGKPEGVEIGS